MDTVTIISVVICLVLLGITIWVVESYQQEMKTLNKRLPTKS